MVNSFLKELDYDFGLQDREFFCGEFIVDFDTNANILQSSHSQNMLATIIPCGLLYSFSHLSCFLSLGVYYTQGRAHFSACCAMQRIFVLWLVSVEYVLKVCAFFLVCQSLTY